LQVALAPVPTTSLAFDDYYRPLAHLSVAERAAANFDHPSALDDGLFIRHLTTLRSGSPIERPTYDFARHLRTEQTHRVDPAPVLLVDGILLLSFPAIREQIDFTVFLDVPEDVRLERRVRRDTVERGRSEQSVRAQFDKTVAPMHELFVQPSASYADVVIQWGDDVTAIAGRVAGLVRKRL
jgi:uridine kinase